MDTVERIKIFRKKAGLTQTEVAEKMEMGQSNYASLENGSRELTLSKLEKLAEVFGVSVGELLGIEGTQSVPNGEQASEIEALQKENERLRTEAGLYKELKEKTEKENNLALSVFEHILLLIDDRISSKGGGFVDDKVAFLAYPTAFTALEGDLKDLLLESLYENQQGVLHFSGVLKGVVEMPPKPLVKGQDYFLADTIEIRLFNRYFVKNRIAKEIVRNGLLKTQYYSEIFREVKKISGETLKILFLYKNEANRLWNEDNKVDIYGRHKQLEQAWIYAKEKHKEIKNSENPTFYFDELGFIEEELPF